MRRLLMECVTSFCGTLLKELNTLYPDMDPTLKEPLLDAIDALNEFEESLHGKTEAGTEERVPDHH
jgi:hypothetical protein